MDGEDHQERSGIGPPSINMYRRGYILCRVAVFVFLVSSFRSAYELPASKLILYTLLSDGKNNDSNRWFVVNARISRVGAYSGLVLINIGALLLFYGGYSFGHRWADHDLVSVFFFFLRSAYE